MGESALQWSTLSFSEWRLCLQSTESTALLHRPESTALLSRDFHSSLWWYSDEAICETFDSLLGQAVYCPF